MSNTKSSGMCYVVSDGKLLPIHSADWSVSVFGVKRPTERNIPEDLNLHQDCYKPQIPLVNVAPTAVMEELAAFCLQSLPGHKGVLATEDGGSISSESLANIYQTTQSKIREDLNHNHCYLIIQLLIISFVNLSTSWKKPGSKRQQTSNSRLTFIEWIQTILLLCHLSPSHDYDYYCHRIEVQAGKCSIGLVSATAGVLIILAEVDCSCYIVHVTALVWFGLCQCSWTLAVRYIWPDL